MVTFKHLYKALHVEIQILVSFSIGYLKHFSKEYFKQTKIPHCVGLQKNSLKTHEDPISSFETVLYLRNLDAAE